MTNAETIAKLNDALEKLIKGYEELQNSYDQLQNENDKLNTEISNLKEKVSVLESDKRDLEDNVNTLQDNTEKDSTHISSMLDKIEGLLGKKNHPAAPVINKVSNENSQKEIVEDIDVKEEKEEQKEKNIFDNINQPERKNAREAFGEIVIEKEEQHSSENKIDLNRMASLLNGFNK